MKLILSLCALVLATSPAFARQKTDANTRGDAPLSITVIDKSSPARARKMMWIKAVLCPVVGGWGLEDVAP